MAYVDSGACMETGSAASMIGGHPQRRNRAIDMFQWGRAALSFVDMNAREHDNLAASIGSRAAGEVLLLAAARACGQSPQKWRQAQACGIPWQVKNFTSLKVLMVAYNDAIAEGINLQSVQEDEVLSDSAMKDAAPFGLTCHGS